jgi:hypothetical protein
MRQCGLDGEASAAQDRNRQVQSAASNGDFVGRTGNLRHLLLCRNSNCRKFGRVTAERG